MGQEFVQNVVMDEEFVKNFVMDARIDPKIVMDLSLFKIGGWNILQPSQAEIPCDTVLGTTFCECCS